MTDHWPATIPMVLIHNIINFYRFIAVTPVLSHTYLLLKYRVFTQLASWLAASRVFFFCILIPACNHNWLSLILDPIKRVSFRTRCDTGNLVVSADSVHTPSTHIILHWEATRRQYPDNLAIVRTWQGHHYHRRVSWHGQQRLWAPQESWWLHLQVEFLNRAGPKNTRQNVRSNWLWHQHTNKQHIYAPRPRSHRRIMQTKIQPALTPVCKQSVQAKISAARPCSKWASSIPDHTRIALSDASDKWCR